MEKEYVLSEKPSHDEIKKLKSTVVRRSKKPLNRSSGSKELRQSINGITTGIDDFQFESSTRTKPSGCTLKRSKTFNKDLHHHKPIINDREILKQYVINLHNIDVDNFATEKINELNNGKFLLHDAIEKQSLRDLSIYLLKHRDEIDIEERNNEGQTPLVFAVALELIDVVKLLIAAGASVNSVDNYGVSALKYAVELGDFDIASLLISKGANAQSVENGL
ncbi:putative ankyrin repeat protein RF_0381 [Hydra vulgaris]|uniref:putative ankyrin repeat protein RF_0381 n=1 Tax=Hydra vulgaris TaxID=6087 RepID=UPI0006410F90|nr:putative ankyrin repeat protein RF_0381 [Hydra vulgaris]